VSYEREEYLEQDEQERDTARRRLALAALLILGLLVLGGIVLVDRLRDVSRLQDCLMTRASSCREVNPPPQPAADAPSTSR
jgi:hypothetical protein